MAAFSAPAYNRKTLMVFRKQYQLSHFTLLMFGLTFVLAAPNSTYAQDPPPQERPRRVMPTEDDPQDVIKIDTDLVPVNVVVTDAKGRLVRSLKKEDFKLFEDGIERKIESFNLEKVAGAPRPLAVVFALDVSGSMTAEEVQRVTAAMREFSRRLSGHPAVFGVMTFGMRVKTIQSP